jgi:hypothetical protein
MTNHDIIASIFDLRKAIDFDETSGVKRLVLNELLKAGIIDQMPEGMLDPYRPCPKDWTALQIAFFDNGTPAKKRKRYKKGKDGKSREVLPRTQMPFGGNIRVWTRENINFNNQKTVAWQANFHCWTADEAKSICEDLLDEKYINQATADLLHHVIGQIRDPKARFSIPLHKTTGTRWMREHVVVTMFDDAGMPDQVVLITPDHNVRTSEPLADLLPNGKDFADKVVRQARLARSANFAAWATEVLP